MAELWTAREIGEALRVSARTVMRLARSKEIPSVMVGKRMRFSRDAVLAAIMKKKRR